MTTQPDYTDFVHTGPGTLAGRYLRLFWQPVSRSEDVASGQALPIKILNDEFTLYRGEDGAAHLLDFRCAHRGTQLSVGWVEGDCVRCLYHGWKYDSTGQCVEQPGEDASFAAKIKIRSYPTQEYMGLIFGYFGEGEPPPMRRHPDFERPFVLEAGPPEVWPNNYFSRLENDAAHAPWTHRETIKHVGRLEQLGMAKLSAEETEYGITTKKEYFDGRPPTYVNMHMPNGNQTRSQVRIEGSLQDAAKLWTDRLFWHIPIDDESCITFTVDMLHLTGAEADAYRARRQSAEKMQDLTMLYDTAKEVLAGKVHVRDLDPTWSTYKRFMVEDYASQVGQGAIPNRTKAAEHLGREDVMVILLRQIWQREMKALLEGRPLKEWVTPAGIADMSVLVA